MNRDDELALRQWLRARDPGPARAHLRDVVRAVPFTEPAARYPRLDLTLRAGFGLAPIARPMLVLLIVLLAVAALVGAAVLQPWRPFPPRGLVAYTAPLAVAGSSGIFLAAADGSTKRQVSPATVNSYEHSPRWSADGRTLLFARTTGLDPLGSCGGVGSVVLYDVATGAERVVATDLRPMNVIEWSPDGQRAAYTYPPTGCGAQVELGVVDLRTGKVATTVVLPQESEQAPSQNVLWHVEWAGDTPRAVPDSVVTVKGPDSTTSIEVRSHDGRSTVHYAWTTPIRTPKLTVMDATGASIDLGLGGLPAWAPDDSAIAFIQPGGPAGIDATASARHHLVVVTAGTWQVRTLTDILMPDGLAGDTLPAVSWTRDGGAIYWLDLTGGHVADVVTGREADLIGIPEVCADLQWQPVGG